MEHIPTVLKATPSIPDTLINQPANKWSCFITQRSQFWAHAQKEWEEAPQEAQYKCPLKNGRIEKNEHKRWQCLALSYNAEGPEPGCWVRGCCRPWRLGFPRTLSQTAGIFFYFTALCVIMVWNCRKVIKNNARAPCALCGLEHHVTSLSRFSERYRLLLSLTTVLDPQARLVSCTHSDSLSISVV